MRWRKKKLPKESELLPGVDELQRLDNILSNVMWARANIQSMLTYVAAHRSDGHDCPVYCVPSTLEMFLGQLPLTALVVLVEVMLKDFPVELEQDSA
jgi:hypothetical protein